MATNETDTLLGKKVATLRKKMKWPLKVMASHLGLSIQQIQRYEKGESKISAITLYKISKIFDADMMYFFENVEKYEEKRVQVATKCDAWNVADM